MMNAFRLEHFAKKWVLVFRSKNAKFKEFERVREFNFTQLALALCCTVLPVKLLGLSCVPNYAQDQGYYVRDEILISDGSGSRSRQLTSEEKAQTLLKNISELTPSRDNYAQHADRDQYLLIGKISRGEGYDQNYLDQMKSSIETPNTPKILGLQILTYQNWFNFSGAMVTKDGMREIKNAKMGTELHCSYYWPDFSTPNCFSTIPPLDVEIAFSPLSLVDRALMDEEENTSTPLLNTNINWRIPTPKDCDDGLVNYASSLDAQTLENLIKEYRYQKWGGAEPFPRFQMPKSKFETVAPK